MSKKFQDASSACSGDIAIVGMSGRFPNAENLDEFWQVLLESKDAITHFSDSELRQAGVAEELITKRNYIKARGILNGIEKFDANLFGISPHDAMIMDPQHRLFLEICWEALEVAGYSSDKYGGLIGVFAGMSDSTYLENNLQANADFWEKHDPYQTRIATSAHFLATKVAYYLNLKGPCLNINTACSTSLVAIVKACQSLNIYECDLAIAGGISIRVPQIKGYLYREGGIFSADGRCRAFDKDATGTVSSNGAGVIILKRLSDAINDGDSIETIIKSYVINNDGAAKVGYTAPSMIEQSRCIATALSYIDDVESISYVEAHGTGTALGDPIEVAALIKAFKHYTQKKKFCAIGSVKTNIGHTDTAAGVIGLIKTALALKNKIIPASLYFKKVNPHIQLSDSPFFINHELAEWKTTYPVRRAGVSSFGIGGTNAHVILEEAPIRVQTESFRITQIISLSAKTFTALQKIQRAFLKYLERYHIESNELANIAYTLHVGRKEFTCRKSYVVKNNEELAIILKKDIAKFKSRQTHIIGKKPRVVFLFSGKNIEIIGFAKLVYKTEPIFRQYIDEIAVYLEDEQRKNVLAYISGETLPGIYSNVTARIKCIALFVFQYGLARILIEWGVKPDALYGYGIGEYLAAYFSGVIKLADAVALVSVVGKIIDLFSPGAKEVDVEDCNIKNNVLIEYQEILKLITLGSVKIPYLSNSSNKWMTDSDLQNEQYLMDYTKVLVCSSINFNLLINHEYNFFISMGVTDNCMNSFFESKNDTSILYLDIFESLKDMPSCELNLVKKIQETIAILWDNNVFINWDAYYSCEKRQRVGLPTYPFENSRYWVEPSVPMSKNMEISVSPSTFHSYWELSKFPPIFDFERRKNWLIFCDNLGFSGSILKELLKQTQNVISVFKGDYFKQLNEFIYQINPISLHDYDMLYVSLVKKNYLPDYIFNCWNISQHNIDEMETFREVTHDDGFVSMVYMAQVFLNLIEKNVDIIVITNNVKKVFNDDKILPDKTTLLGACLVIPQEYLYASCRVIDVGMIEIKSFIKNNYPLCVINELNSYHKYNIIAYRKGLRFVESFKKIYLKKAKDNESFFKKNGTYLITGGLGKIGMHLAEFLAKNYSANLILQGHTVVPKEIDINQIFGDPEVLKYDVTINEKLRVIADNAASVLVLQADVGDYSQMAKLFDFIRQKYQKLDGVFHLAGIASYKTYVPIKALNLEEIKQLFWPKVQGTKVLQTLLNKEDIGFCLLYSSIASILGGVGFAAYAASNCYLDSIAQNYQSNLLWVSINWDAWGFSENIKSNATSYPDLYCKLEPKYAMASLQHCSTMFNYYHNFIVSLVDVNDRLEKWINLRDNASLINIKNNFSSSAIKKNENNVEKIKKIFESCLGMTGIGYEDNFYDIGGDSLSAIRLLDFLEKEFSVRVKLVDFFKYNSISKLEKIIESNHKMSLNFPLVKIKESGNHPPLFLIHPVSGFIYCYLELAKYLPDNCPCYAIQDPNIDSELFSFSSIEDIASFYLNIIQSVQPTGPYFIGGYSLGSSIAFEICRQLVDKKNDIGGLFLIDGWASFSNQFWDYNNFIRSMQRVLNELDNHIPNELHNKSKLIDLASDRIKLLLKYLPPKLSGVKTILFKAKDILPEYIEVDEKTNHWQNYVIQSIAVHHISGNHVTMLKGEGAKQVAKIMSFYIA